MDTNAQTESFNAKIKNFKRKFRGVSGLKFFMKLFKSAQIYT